MRPPCVKKVTWGVGQGSRTLHSVLQAPFETFFASAFDELTLQFPETLLYPDRADILSVLGDIPHSCFWRSNTHSFTHVWQLPFSFYHFWQNGLFWVRNFLITRRSYSRVCILHGGSRIWNIVISCTPSIDSLLSKRRETCSKSVLGRFKPTAKLISNLLHGLPGALGGIFNDRVPVHMFMGRVTFAEGSLFLEGIFVTKCLVESFIRARSPRFCFKISWSIIIIF